MKPDLIPLPPVLFRGAIERLCDNQTAYERAGALAALLERREGVKRRGAVIRSKAGATALYLMNQNHPKLPHEFDAAMRQMQTGFDLMSEELTRPRLAVEAEGERTSFISDVMFADAVHLILAEIFDARLQVTPVRRMGPEIGEADVTFVEWSNVSASSVFPRGLSLVKNGTLPLIWNMRHDPAASTQSVLRQLLTHGVVRRVMAYEAPSFGACDLARAYGDALGAKLVPLAGGETGTMASTLTLVEVDAEGRYPVRGGMVLVVRPDYSSDVARSLPKLTPGSESFQRQRANALSVLLIWQVLVSFSV